MNRFFYHLAKFFPVVPLKTLTAFTGQRTIFPFYHAVSNDDLIHIKHLYRIRSIKAFEKDLDFLTKKFIPTDIVTFLEKFRNNEPIKQNTMLLSFDDGLREFHDIIAPTLLRKGISATCFLNSGFIDNRDLFFRYKASILAEKVKNNSTPALTKRAANYLNTKNLYFKNISKSILAISYPNRSCLDELAGILEVNFSDYLTEKKPYMSSDQINALIGKGFRFGAHSIDHPQFSDISLEEQLRQTRESINDISSRFHLDYKLFSFPFTDFGVSKQFFSQVFDHTKPIANLTFGCAGLKNDCCKGNFQRIPIETDNFTARDIIGGEYYYYIAKSLVNKNTIPRGN
jgi:peptidoglycan/xylan/chitin deacetylase (PgdA/CDA1 family)